MRAARGVPLAAMGEIGQNSGSAGERRTLRFESVGEMLAEARSLAAAPRLERLGTWTLGQALNHLAAWIEYPYKGYPPELVVPEEVRAKAAARKERIMSSPMAPGERLPGVEAGTTAIEVVPDEVGLARLEEAAKLLEGDPAEPAPYPDPAFGTITRHEWMQMNLRHAELHLSFFRAGQVGAAERGCQRFVLDLVHRRGDVRRVLE